MERALSQWLLPTFGRMEVPSITVGRVLVERAPCRTYVVGCRSTGSRSARPVKSVRTGVSTEPRQRGNERQCCLRPYVFFF